MSARVWSLFAWALVAASAVFWGLKLGSRPQAVPAHATVAATTVALRGDLSRVLGADPVVAPADTPEVVAADTRLTLIGVFSPRGSRHASQGLALISVDGKPAKTYRVGARVDGDRVLQSVSLRSASLGPAGGATQLSLNIAAPVEAARGRMEGAADGRAVPDAPGTAFRPASPSSLSAPSSPSLSQAPGMPPSFSSGQPAPQADAAPTAGAEVPPPREATVPGRPRSSIR